MQKQEMERIEELKKEMMARTFYREGMPEEVIKVVQEAFDGIKNQYKELHCNNSSIQEYIEGNLAYVKSYLETTLGEERKERQMEQVQLVTMRMKKELEDVDISLEDKKRKQENHKRGISEIGTDDKRITVKITGVMQEYLKNVQSAQNRILGANGFSMDRIEFIQQNIHGFIRYFINKNEKRIGKILEEDSNSLKEQLLNEYEQFLLQSGKEEKLETTNKSRREEFVEGLDSGISLEEQRDFSREQNNEKRLEERQGGKSAQALPDNVIE